ncbi:MAG: YfcE family phosphodiesterase [Thermaceae bacterium]|nr:YfcE family phosphodiesterase [Thermaceae bacterium]
MKIGLISDIHGNLHALEAVLKALGGEAVDLTLCAGDLVVYGAHPAETLKLLRDSGIPSVAGNYDHAVAFGLEAASSKPSSPANEALKRAALRWTQTALPKGCKRYLAGLPWRMDYQLDGRQITLLHAGLEALDEFLTPQSADELHTLALRLGAEVAVLGHTHLPFTFLAGDTLIINPGAVGRSLDGDTRASFAILETENLSVQHLRIEYDVERAAQAIAGSGMPGEIAEMVRRGLRRVEETYAAAER